MTIIVFLVFRFTKAVTERLNEKFKKLRRNRRLIDKQNKVNATR